MPDPTDRFTEAVINSISLDSCGLELRNKLEDLVVSEQDNPNVTKQIVMFLCSAFLLDDGSLVKESLALDKRVSIFFFFCVILTQF